MSNPNPKMRPSLQEAFMKKYAEKFEDFQAEIEKMQMKSYEKDVAANQKNRDQDKYANKELPKHLPKN